MAGYIGVPLETDATELASQSLDTLMDNIPGYVPREGHIEVWMVEVWARMVAEARDVASSVPTSIFRYFGQSLMGIPAVAGSAAQTTATFTMIDNQGYTVPAETTVAFRTAGDELVPFRTLEDAVVPPGSLTVAGVVIEALEEGTVHNGLGPGPVELVDALAYVASVAATGTTTGGVEEESDDAYLDRLTAELQLLAPRPILPQDFAVLARRVTGVHRALAIDGYNPLDLTTENERMVTIALADASGNPVPQDTKDETAALLDARREVNFVVHIIDPTYTAINVVFSVVALTTHDLADVEARAELAVQEYLSPATWGGGDASPPEWRTNANVVRYLEVAQVVNAVDGVDYVESLTVNGVTTDVPLDGVAPLPQVGTVDGTVTYGV